MLLDSAIRARRDDLPDGGPLPFAVMRVLEDSRAGAEVPPVRITADPPSEAPALAVVPETPAPPPRTGSRWLSPVAGIGSLLLHGAALAAFLAFATSPPRQADLPSVDVELVQPDAEPPPAAAAPAAPAETPPTETPPTETPPTETPPVETPPVEIALPPVEDIPLPAELAPPEPATVSEPPPVDLPPPDTETPPLADELTPPEQPAVDPATVTIDPPPVLDLPLPAELTPPPPRQETPRVEAVPPPRPSPPAPRREQVRPPVQRERTERPQPRRQPPPAARPPSAASAGQGVTSQASARTATPPPSYLGRVMAQLHRAKPAGTGQQGRAVVRFSIQRSGAVAGVGLAASSGNSAVDQAALAMVRRAAPFPPLPAEYGPASMPLTVPVNFR